MSETVSRTHQDALFCLDLFSGAGGFSEGFRQAGFHTVAATDIDPSAGATYDLNHRKHGTAFILGDISRREVREEIFAAVGTQELDVIIGGPPCQGFSQVRNHARLIEHPLNRLYRDYVSVIGKLRPRTFVMENVPGLENLAGGLVRAQILEDLTLDGEYRVECRVLDAAAFGVPQNRLRILFIGVRRDLGIAPRFPESPFSNSIPILDRKASGSRWSYRHRKSPETVRSLAKLLDPASVALVTVEQAIGDLTWLRPNAKLVRKPSNDPIEYEAAPTSAYQRARRGKAKELFNADVPSIREDTVKRLRSIPQGGNFRDLPEELAARYLSGKKWGPELGRETLSRKYFFAYRKLHPAYFSWTLNTKADCVFHYGTPRALTVREFARLHSFDDTYHFLAGDRHSRYRQIGNAVPPLFAQAIGRTISAILSDADKLAASHSRQLELPIPAPHVGEKVG
ncbi:DNA cytosine methyltransferase [Bradyrhizobium japonicum]|uniref:DNA cytosine methyltransferase n=1 Tax=Bradyrhizobium japonicum TaxID=375 RepID=UPI001BA6D305|nr:DNA cytosine methyltransferase [Bradyrhizobium japonicum]MBR0960884.1 DNA cytosine methyltransferase [Bradyrhizobium japonicum]